MGESRNHGRSAPKRAEPGSRSPLRSVLADGEGWPLMSSRIQHAGRLLFFVAAIVSLIGCRTSSTSVSTSNTSSTSSAGTSLTPNGVVVYPGSASIPINGKAQFTAFAPSQPTATFTWTVTGGGSITSAGLYTAPASPAAVTITATASSTSGLIGTSTLSVLAAQGILLSPSAIAIPAGATQTFTATVNGQPLTSGVIWQVNNAPNGDGLHGFIDGSGNYTAPLTPPPFGSTTITAVMGTGSSTVSGTATAAVVFSNESLNGSYAFSYKGAGSSGFLAAAGSFIAQGRLGASGQIFGGVQDVLTAASSSAAHSQFTGTFAVNPDGTAIATLSNTMTWALSLVSNPVGGATRKVLVMRFDSTATGSGTIEAQNPALLTASAFSGNYAFGLSGIDSTGAPLVMAGRFFADGVGIIPLGSGAQDINDNGKSTLSVSATTTGTAAPVTSSTTVADTTLQGSFAMDSSVPTSGRGIVTLSSSNTAIFANGISLQLAFYIVDNTHLKVVETDNSAAVAGDFYSAANTPSDGAFTTAGALPKGNYAFTVSGKSSNGAYAAGGIFTSGGTSSSTTSGALSGVLDVNNGPVDIRTNTTITSSTFSVDQSFGRISLPLTVGGATINFAGYTAAYNTVSGPVEFVELIDLDTQTVAAGVAYPQNGAASSLNGNYGLNIAGITGPKNAAIPQDVLGQVSTVGNTSFDGTLNTNNFTLSAIAAHVSLTNATVVAAPSSNGRGTATLGTGSTTYSLTYYVLDSNTALLLEIDGIRVTTGVMLRQF